MPRGTIRDRTAPKRSPLFLAVHPDGLRNRATSTWFVCVGIATVSWDRFGNFEVIGFNVKVPTLAFALGLILTLVDSLIEPRPRQRRHPVQNSIFLVVVAFVIAALFAEFKQYPALQVVAVILGSIVPFLAVYYNARQFGGIDRLLTAFVLGGFVASLFGLYQISAYYAGLPQVVPYEAVGGGLGRISSFSYESGYFGYFLILVIAALFARSALRGEPVPVRLLLFFVAVLALANSRATFATVPLLFALLYFRLPSSTIRGKLAPVVAYCALLIGIVLLAVPALAGGIGGRVASLFDPTEATSNAPRLAVYEFVWPIIRDHLPIGIGPGNLIQYVPLYGGIVDAGATSNTTVANSVWLQALLDGGIPLLVAELFLVLVAAFTLYKRSLPVARMLIAGWLAAVLVSSMVTSYYFDMKLWVMLALAVASATQFGSEADGEPISTNLPQHLVPEFKAVP